MNVLIIGYGSIGQRHYTVLSLFSKIKKIDIVTRQKLDEKVTFTSLKEILDLNKYDYFVIASETHKHYEQLLFLEDKVKDKIIFCEKPLFEKYKVLESRNNFIFLGYVLRFHPLLKKLKSLIENEKVLSIHIFCGQYLPTWRENRDYRESYSAKKEQGGGVLLDLSHELDYLQWLCGDIVELKSYQEKISDLEINSDDMVFAIGKTLNNTYFNLSLDYITKIAYRRVVLHLLEKTVEVDFVQNSLVVQDKLGIKETCTVENMDRNYMFEQMHKSALLKSKDICTLDEGLTLLKVVTTIQEQNNG